MVITLKLSFFPIRLYKINIINLFDIYKIKYQIKKDKFLLMEDILKTLLFETLH